MSFDIKLTNNDISIGTDGDLEKITDTPKLRQDIIKMILTPLGSCKAHPWYGCSVNEQIIGSTLPFNIMNAQILSSVSESLDRLKSLQSIQKTSQQVSLAELIQDIQSVIAERDQADPRAINVLVSIITYRLTKMEEYFTIVS